jgi:hypothetical protein
VHASVQGRAVPVSGWRSMMQIVGATAPAHTVPGLDHFIEISNRNTNWVTQAMNRDEGDGE